MSEHRWALINSINLPKLGEPVPLGNKDFEPVTILSPGEVAVPVGDLRSLLDWLDVHVSRRYPLDNDSYVDVIREDFRAILPPEEPEEPEPLPCPFCGGPPQYQHNHGYSPAPIRCPYHTDWMDKKEWNRRATPEGGA